MVKTLSDAAERIAGSPDQTAPQVKEPTTEPKAMREALASRNRFQRILRDVEDAALAGLGLFAEDAADKAAKLADKSARKFASYGHARFAVMGLGEIRAEVAAQLDAWLATALTEKLAEVLAAFNLSIADVRGDDWDAMTVQTVAILPDSGPLARRPNRPAMTALRGYKYPADGAEEEEETEEETEETETAPTEPDGQTEVTAPSN